MFDDDDDDAPLQDGAEIPGQQIRPCAPGLLFGVGLIGTTNRFMGMPQNGWSCE